MEARNLRERKGMYREEMEGEIKGGNDVISNFKILKIIKNSLEKWT